MDDRDAPARQIGAEQADVGTAAAPVCLTGTLRGRGTDLFLEQQASPADERAGGWTTPRRYQLLATPTTQAAVDAAMDGRVTVTGRPVYIAARHRVVIALDSVASLAVAAGPD